MKCRYGLNIKYNFITEIKFSFIEIKDQIIFLIINIQVIILNYWNFLSDMYI